MGSCDRPRDSEESSMSDKTCTECGSAISESAQFCTNCGTPVVANPEPPTQPAPAVDVPPAGWQTDATMAVDQTTITPPPSSPPPPQPAAPVAPTEPTPEPAWQPQPQPPLAPAGWGQQPSQAPAPAPPSWQPEQPQQPQPGQPPPAQWGTGPSAATLGAPPQKKKKGGTFSALLAFVGAILLVVAAFTPWVRTNVEVLNGWSSSNDAKTVVGLAVFTLLLGIAVLAGARHIIMRLALIGVAIAAVVIAIVNILSVSNDLPASLNAEFGIGLVLLPIAGVIILWSGLFVPRSKR